MKFVPKNETRMFLRKKLKIVVYFIIIILLFLGLTNSAYAVDIKMGEYSEQYLKWLNLPEEEKQNTIKPLPVNIREDYKYKDKRSIVLMSAYNELAIPSKYDLRDYIDIEVKDQMYQGLCWAFASLSTIETNLALNNKTYKFSERHIDYDTANDFNYGKGFDNSDRVLGDGGNNSTAFLYYSRGSGPILEEYMPFEDNHNQIEEYKYPKNVAIQKVDNMLYFPNIYKYKVEGKIVYEDANWNDYTDSEIKNLRNNIKKHIMTNGGIFALVYSRDISEKGSVPVLNSDQQLADHAITIIGWDDNFSKDNFENNKPNSDGAYIALNSWGEEWGEDGIFYISYEDALVEAEMSAVSEISDIKYDSLYQYDSKEMYNHIYTNYASNVFTSNENETLTEIMVGTFNDDICDVYVNPSGSDLNINNLTKIASDIVLKPGYNTIKLDKGVELTKDNKFAIVLELTKGVGVVLDDSSEQESFVSSDGVTWKDIYSSERTMNLCIKAYTQTKNKSFIMSNIIGKGYEDVGGQFSFSIDTSYIEDGKDVTVQIRKEGNDVTENFIIKGNKINGKGAFITLNCPSDIKMGEYEVNCNINGASTVSKTFNVTETDDEYVILKLKDKAFYNYIKSIIANYFEYEKNLEIVALKSDINGIQFMQTSEKFSDISGIENFKNLFILNLLNCDIVSLESIEKLTFLNTLGIGVNKDLDLSPISNLTNLRCLKLNGDINSLNFLENLTNLDELEFNNTSMLNLDSALNNVRLRKIKFSSSEIGSLDFIKNLTNLEELQFDKNSTSKLISIPNIISLRKMTFSSSDISSLEIIKNLTNLEEISFYDCRISNLLSIPDMENIKALSISESNVDSLSWIQSLNNLSRNALR